MLEPSNAKYGIIYHVTASILLCIMQCAIGTRNHESSVQQREFDPAYMPISGKKIFAEKGQKSVGW